MHAVKTDDKFVCGYKVVVGLLDLETWKGLGRDRQTESNAAVLWSLPSLFHLHWPVWQVQPCPCPQPAACLCAARPVSQPSVLSSLLPEGRDFDPARHGLMLLGSRSPLLNGPCGLHGTFLPLRAFAVLAYTFHQAWPAECLSPEILQAEGYDLRNQP